MKVLRMLRSILFELISMLILIGSGIGMLLSVYHIIVLTDFLMSLQYFAIGGLMLGVAIWMTRGD